MVKDAKAKQGALEALMTVMQSADIDDMKSFKASRVKSTEPEKETTDEEESDS